VRKALKRMGWSQPKIVKQIDLPVEQKLSKTDPVDTSEQIATEINETPVAGNDAERHEIITELSELEQVSYDPDP